MSSALDFGIEVISSSCRAIIVVLVLVSLSLAWFTKCVIMTVGVVNLVRSPKKEMDDGLD
jgi:hypothetical protein